MEQIYNNDYMGYEEQISALLDGELSPDITSDIFSQLAQNHELRQEFANQVSIKNFMTAGIEQPPVHLHSNIQQTIGLNNISNKFWNTAIGKYSIITSTAVITFLITWFNLNNDSNSLIADNKFNLIDNNSSFSNSPIAQNNDVETSSSIFNLQKKQIPIIFSKEEQVEEKSVAIFDEPSSILPDTEYRKSVEDNYQPISNSQFKTTSPVALNEINKNDVANRLNPIYFISDKYNEEQVITLSIRGLSSENLNDFNLKVENVQKINDFTVGIYYNLNSYFKLGMEAGQENFNLIYESLNGIYIEKIYQTQSNTWIGFSGELKYCPISDLEQVSHYNRLTLGATNIGAISRFETGLTFELDKRFEMVFGANYINLVYGHQDNFYTSGKYGFVYGINFNF